MLVLMMMGVISTKILMAYNVILFVPNLVKSSLSLYYVFKSICSVLCHYFMSFTEEALLSLSLPPSPL